MTDRCGTAHQCRRCPRTTGRRRRGLCDACYWHALTHGYLHKYPTTRRTVHLEDVRELRQQRLSRKDIAARIGVSYSAIATAEWRARKRGDTP